MYRTEQLLRAPEFDHSSAIDVWRDCPALRVPLETRLHETIAEVGATLAGPLHRVVAAGGKRLRPALTLTVAQLTGEPATPAALDLAAAVELLHSATLVHDDLIDGAALRRGTPTISDREGSGVAVVAGDLLIAAASVLAAGVSRAAAVVLARTLADLCQGQAAEDALRYDADAAPGQLIELSRLKTGSLLRAACVLGAEAAGCDDVLTAALAMFGEQFGISLQLVDDVLDVVSSPALAGKPVGADFVAGTMTLPAVLALRAHPALGKLLGPGGSTNCRPQALRLLRTTEAIQPTVAAAVEHAERAAAGLRAAARSSADEAAVERLAQWPMHFLTAQLRSKVDPGLRRLVELPGRTW